MIFRDEWARLRHQRASSSGEGLRLAACGRFDGQHASSAETNRLTTIHGRAVSERTTRTRRLRDTIGMGRANHVGVISANTRMRNVTVSVTKPRRILFSQKYGCDRRTTVAAAHHQVVAGRLPKSLAVCATTARQASRTAADLSQASAGSG